MSPLKRFRQDDGGFAMITVIGSMFVLTALVFASLAYAMNSLPLARKSQDHHAAMAAAQAGVDDYLRRLAENDTYWLNGGVDAANPAFTPAGAAIPGTTSDARFTYTPLMTPAEIAAGRVVRLKATGIVNGVKRSVSVELKKRSFLEFLYFTDKETTDPAAYPNPWSAMTPATAMNLCNRYYYSTPARDPSCVDVVFASDTLDGPVHTNDAMYINGSPNFTSPNTFSSWPNPPDPNNRFRVVAAGMSPSNNKPKYADILPLPLSNTELQTTAQTQGCLFRGATRIRFNSNGTLTIRSPYTRVSNPCFTGNPSVNFTAQTVTPPANTVIYVDNVTNPTGADTACPTNDSGNVLQTWPQINDDSAFKGLTTFNCWSGDAYIEGNVKGRYTLGTKGNVVVTGDLRYTSRAANGDVLGLIADGNVQVYHPVYCNAVRNNGANRGNCNSAWSNVTPVRPAGEPAATGALSNIQIDAAVMSVQHTFTVANYDLGPPLNTLSVFGALIQNYRGAVGRSSTTGGVVTPLSGYTKDYVYDTRLKAAPPPAFLDPRESAWRVGSFSEQRPD